MKLWGSYAFYCFVSVSIKRADYAKTLESVIDNSVDFGVVSLPVTDVRLTVVPIHRDELVIITPPDHPLAPPPLPKLLLIQFSSRKSATPATPSRPSSTSAVSNRNTPWN